MQQRVQKHTAVKRLQCRANYAASAKSSGVSLTSPRFVVSTSVKNDIRYFSRRAALLFVLITCGKAHAHVMQQLSWFQVERNVDIRPRTLHVHHECKFDKNMFRADDPILDVDGDSTASRHEIAQFCQQASNYVSQDFTVLADGLPCAVRQEGFAVNDDDSGFTSDLVADIPDLPTSGSQTLDIVDPAYLFTFPADTASTATIIAAEAPLVVGFAAEKPSHKVQVPKSPHVAVQLSHQSAAASADERSSATRP